MGNRDRPTFRMWRWLRRTVQVLALLLFLFLLIATRQNWDVALPVNLFFRLDPLAGIAAMLASRSWLAPMALGIVTLLVTLVFGRVWCGWVCPLGTVLDWTPSRRTANGISRKWKLVKYGVLFAIGIAALWQSLTFLIFDPLTILGRTVGGSHCSWP